MREFTDTEIIKALECCGELISNPCSQCPYFHEKPCLQLKRDALELIKRQQAEIEELQPYNLHYGNLRMEIAHEVADRLKEYLIKPELPWDDFYVTESAINGLLKEMENEQ